MDNYSQTLATSVATAIYSKSHIGKISRFTGEILHLLFIFFLCPCATQGFFDNGPTKETSPDKPIQLMPTHSFHHSIVTPLLLQGLLILRSLPILTKLLASIAEQVNMRGGT